MFFFLIIVW